MNNKVDLAFGVLTPEKLVRAAKNIMDKTASPGEAAIMRAYQPKAPMQGTGSAAGIALIGGALLLLVGLRFGAAWYVGKKIGRPTSGTILGGVFGAPALGVLSLFPPSGKSARGTMLPPAPATANKRHKAKRAKAKRRKVKRNPNAPAGMRHKWLF
jgi:hypothetical protein